ncbi:MAG: porin family protein [Tidjanibacter sp.]|nr:porin family protein [Tidjanibacter sp.]
MKRFLTFVAATLATLSIVSAQDVTFGVRFGANCATLAGVEGDTPRVGIVGGGIAECLFSHHFALQTELLFSMQGARYNDGAGTKATYCYDYFNLPVLAKIYLFDHTVALLAGVQFGYLPRPSILFEVDSRSGATRWRKRLEEGSYNPLEYSAAIGAEYHIWRGLGVDLRYTLGLWQIHYGRSSSSISKDYVTIPDNRNSVFQLALFYRF